MTRNPVPLRTEPHLYVTRAATLEFQGLARGGFEEARRELSKLLLRAEPDPTRPNGYRAPWEDRWLRAYMVEDEGLLIVAKVELEQEQPKPLTGRVGKR